MRRAKWAQEIDDLDNLIDAMEFITKAIAAMKNVECHGVSYLLTDASQKIAGAAHDRVQNMRDAATRLEELADHVEETVENYPREKQDYLLWLLNSQTEKL